jgi:hypothetical protein
MKHTSYAQIAGLLLWFASSSMAADAPDRPPNVAASAWVAINDRLGIVLVQDNTPPAVSPNQPLLLRPPVGGYFMVKGISGWARLVIVEPIKGPGDAG